MSMPKRIQESGYRPACNAEDIESGEEVLKDKRVCSGCIGENFLQASVKKEGQRDKCSYCGKQGKTISAGRLADQVGEAFERHYHRTPTDASAFEYVMMKETGYQWEREGQPAKYAIAEASEIDESIAEDVRQILESRNYDHDSAAIGEEREFDAEAHYEEGGANDSELQAGWALFQKSLQTETRLFNQSAERVLNSIFEGIGSHSTRDGKKVIVEAGPGKSISSLFRARVFQSDAKLEAALRRPDLELGPPPSATAVAGRMNSSGIGIFYGSTEPSVALAETRPPVGSRVLVGRFEITRSLRLLDVEVLRSIYVEGSIFDSAYIRRLAKAKFLRTLSDRMTMPVMPDHEPFEYLVTQAIADYLASRTEPTIDGIIYASVQNGKGKSNVALFHKASRVVSLEIPEGTEINVSLYETSDEGTCPDYMVWENTPADQTPANDAGGDEWDVTPAPRSRSEHDTRAAALKLDVTSLRVHHVEAATFKASKFPVRRHRAVKTARDDF